MKLKNKLLSAGLVACMVVPMAMPVCAKTVNPAAPDSQSTTLKYEVGSHYTWTIHSAIDFGKDEGFNYLESNKNTIKVTENVIPEGQKLSITVKGDDGDNGKFTIRSGEGTGNVSLTYTFISSFISSEANPTEVLSVAAGENEKTTEMSFHLHNLPSEGQSAEIAGNYLGYITYIAKIVDA